MSVETAERRQYIKGFIFAIVLTALSFIVAIYTSWSATAIYWAIGIFALAQIIVHFRYFLHIDLSKQKREDLHLILFSTLLLIIMVGGTLWVLSDLSHRMH